MLSRDWLMTLFLVCCSRVVTTTTENGCTKPQLTFAYILTDNKTKDEYSQGTQIDYRCVEGFKWETEQNAPKTTKCVNGTWQPEISKCEQSNWNDCAMASDFSGHYLNVPPISAPIDFVPTNFTKNNYTQQPSKVTEGGSLPSWLLYVIIICATIVGLVVITLVGLVAWSVYKQKQRKKEEERRIRRERRRRRSRKSIKEQEPQKDQGFDEPEPVQKTEMTQQSIGAPTMSKVQSEEKSVPILPPGELQKMERRTNLRNSRRKW